MFNKNKIIYGLFTLLVGFALSLNTAIAQETDQYETSAKMFKGKVVDASTNQPLPNVEVEIMDQTATTDQDGIFTFENLDTKAQDAETQGVETQDTQTQGMGSDEVEIKISHEGYEELSESVSVDELLAQATERAQTGQDQQTQQQDEGFGQEQEDIKTFELQPENEDY